MTTVEKLHSDDLREAFLATADAHAAVAGRTSRVDEAVADAVARHLDPEFSKGLAVVAVGGYGRRELFPYSDIDLLLLVERDPKTPAERAALSAFLQELWDRGLRLSQSVRTPQNCCELQPGNTELHISLLDQRFLTGDAELYVQLAAALPRFLRSERRTLVRELCRMARARHSSSRDTIQHLEPDIKETPGGLRDLHMFAWLEKLREEAVTSGNGLGEAQDFLFALRCWLHYRAGRDDNRLGFEAQEELSERGFLGPTDAAAWMRQFYRHAREVHRAALRELERAEDQGGSLLASFRDWRSRLSNSDFTVAKDRVYFRNPSYLEQDPMLALRLFEFVGRHGLKLAADTERRLEERRTANPMDWDTLRRLLQLPHFTTALRALVESGSLPHFLPEWERIDCLVIRDFHHRYTVDEHTLVAIETLAELRGAADEPHRRFAELLSEVDEPELLYFSLLFHDTGKAPGRGGHVSESLRLAWAAMERLKMPPEKQRAVAMLIEQHLELSSVMTSRDPDEPSTARYLAEQIGTIENLKRLALLSYADISAVHPGAMTPWRLDQLWNLYLVTYNELTRELETARIEAPGHWPPEKAAFVNGFPTRYLRTQSEEEIEAHFALSGAAAKLGVALELKKLSGVYGLTIITRNRPFLFATLAGAISSFGLNILKAEAFGNHQGLVLDTFVFEDPLRTLELNPPEIDRFKLIMERAATGKLDISERLRSRPKPKPPSRGARVKPLVAFNQTASETATLIEVVAQDRPGLLHDLARCFSTAGCSIEVVLIDTEAHKALDVFYVTAGGRKLPTAMEPTLRDALLEACGP
jgi:[protein-PII] uridylyltransferase